MIRTTTAAVVAALAVSGLVAPAASAQTVNTVTWNIKGSFVRYLTGFAKGHAQGQDPAKFNGSAFELPIDLNDSYIDDNGNGVIDLNGGIELKGHKGLGPNGGWGLDLEYSDLKIEVKGTSAQLVGDYKVSGAGMGGNGVVSDSGNDVHLLTFDLTAPIKRGEAFNFAPAKTTVTEEFSKSMIGAYKKGTTLDDGLISLNGTIDKAPAPGGTTDNGSSGDLGVGGIIGIVVAIIAALGAGGFALTQLNIPALLGR
ncbi:putative cell-surface hemin receptor [Corynebacterium renale]|uniref:HtaA domain-containing protein n=1 Tax=Corynebacterium renale TaxID=1724 RepID=UPI000DA382CF|nr:HtaA domain-containing protein [Corynebacterium renale]SQG63557.1 putative cell-surface hemin receptor [Corynebacterium renale]